MRRSFSSDTRTSRFVRRGRLWASLPTLAAALVACGVQETAAAARNCGWAPATETGRQTNLPLPALTGRVVDEADLLTASAEETLSRELADLESRTRDQLVVVTTPRLNGETIEQYGLRLGNGWGIGQKDLHNGVLLIVVPEDRKVRIEVGCGLEGLLTDRRAAAVIDDVLLPRLRRGAYEDAISSGTRAIGHILEQDSRRPLPRATPQ